MTADPVLRVRGARQNNLKGISVDIPKYRMVVMTGISGSGKSTLAFDTIYAEGQRRYVESLSAYARQFLEVMDKPAVDSIEGLSPAISIQQKTTNKNPRSTVGTITEIYDYMRLLYARIGRPHCTKCGRAISSQSVDAICDAIVRDMGGRDVLVMAPVVRRKKGTHEKVLAQAKKDGYSRVRVDGAIVRLDGPPPRLEKQKWHDVEIVVDRIKVSEGERSRVFEAVQTAIKASGGTASVGPPSGEASVFSQSNACPRCGISIGEMEPRAFSFNSPFGMCKECSGLGTKSTYDEDLVIPDPNLTIVEDAIRPLGQHGLSRYYRRMRSYMKAVDCDMYTPVGDFVDGQLEGLLHGADVGGKRFPGVFAWLDQEYATTTVPSKRDWIKRFMRSVPCPACGGYKLRPEVLAVLVGSKSIMEACRMSVDACLAFFAALELGPAEKKIGREILKEITERLEFLSNVGLGYISLDRGSYTLSGGESQRIRLATQIGANLTGVLYVLDEPTIGLHQRDNARLISTLTKLRDLGNTVIVVEHDEEVMRSADWIVDLGPGAGRHGGSVVFEGTMKKLVKKKGSLTAGYLNGSSVIRRDRRDGSGKSLVVRGAEANNLKKIDVEIPLGRLVVVTGVSGSGKSTLVNDILYRALHAEFYFGYQRPGRHKGIDGVDLIGDVVAIDQSPIGRTPRSNPATYIDAFSPIRDLFAETPLSRERGYTAGQFSFNTPAGRCFACDGDGVKRIEMQFLADVFVKCDECDGKRYDSETLAVRYKGRNIAEVLEMTAEEALEFFVNVRAARRRLQTLNDVGLGYIRLGQSSTTLSGGEAQRVKLAFELSKYQTGETLYILDEPTTGLHFADVEKLLSVLDRLVSAGNTVLVIEHNMDIIRNADWIIDLGPEGGDEGGSVVATGSPEQVARAPGSYTGMYLKKAL